MSVAEIEVAPGITVSANGVFATSNTWGIEHNGSRVEMSREEFEEVISTAQAALAGDYEVTTPEELEKL